jgi:glycine/D-amino acid oxidase-like deaminating enzyme
MNHYDVIMIGGGAMACATAYHLLKADPTVKIAIVERDPSYAQSSTVLSDGNIRIQFNLRENILISQYGMAMTERFAEEMAVGDSKPQLSFRRQGNLFLTDEAGKAASLEGMALQQSLGCTVEWLDAETVHARFPFIDPSQIAGGTFGANDGTMDPQAVLLGYRNKALAMGAVYVVDEVTGILTADGRVTGVRLADGAELCAPIVLNSSGAWGTALARSVGIDLPIKPIMRHVFHLETTVQPTNVVPLTVFPSGLYIIHEHDGHFTCGKSLASDPESFDFTFRRQVFVDEVWEDLAHYIPAFEQVKLVGGWVGLYDVNTLDHNAVLGEHPHLKGFLLANGFSGHGFQQCHAVGSYLADVILQRTPQIDLSIFSPMRLVTNTPVYENRRRIV